MVHERGHDPDIETRPPRLRRDPFAELERMDLAVKIQGVEEHRTMFDPSVHPKPPHPKEEGITDPEGRRPVDMMGDTPNLDDFLVPEDRGAPEVIGRDILEGVDL